MCRYYAHRHACAHTSLSFAAFCDPAALVQNPCGERHIWQTIAVEEVCEDCRGLYQGQDQGHGYGYGYYGGGGYAQGKGSGRR
jgi:hypothetical protein